MNPFRLLITRNISPAVVEDAAQKGIKVIEREFIKIAATNEGGNREIIKKLLEQEIPVAFTSKNAVKNVIAMIGESAVPHWKIFCIDGVTMELVKKYFGEISVCGAAAYADELAPLIIEKHKGEKIVFFCGNRRRDVLPDTLRQHNIEVKEVVVYETQLTPQVISEPFDGVSFFSPSAAESFFSANSLPGAAVCFSIGLTTSTSIKNYTKNTIITSTRASEEEMLNTVANYLNLGEKQRR